MEVRIINRTKLRVEVMTKVRYEVEFRVGTYVEIVRTSEIDDVNMGIVCD